MQATRLYTALLVSFLVSATADSLAAQTITHVPLYTFNNNATSAGPNISVSGAGDVNGDGRADLIVGFPYDGTNNTFGFQAGSARVLSGSDGSVLYSFHGDSFDELLGWSVSGAGDINGDGSDDLIVGVIHDDNNGFSSGSARVLSGSDGSVLHNFNGDSVGDLLGTSVSGAGDVNGDGTPDLIVGAPEDDNNGDRSGSARVLSGSDGSVLYNFDGGDRLDFFGSAVSGAGDVNGDGRADLIVGAPSDNNTSIISGSARVLSGNDGSVLYTFDGDNDFDFFGRSVSGAGDVNGDGFDDLIVGAPEDDNNGPNSGSARVFSGSDGSVLYNFDGDSEFDFFGQSVSGAGDVNGDGIPDLIVGAPSRNNCGSARVFSGSDGSLLYNFLGDSRGDFFGHSVSGTGDVNGDGIDDFIVGAILGGANGRGYARVFVSQIILLGDCNLDGLVNFLDIAPFISILAGADSLAEADINQDGDVDFLDIAPFISLLSL